MVRALTHLILIIFAFDCGRKTIMRTGFPACCPSQIYTPDTFVANSSSTCTAGSPGSRTTNAPDLSVLPDTTSCAMHDAGRTLCLPQTSHGVWEYDTPFKSWLTISEDATRWSEGLRTWGVIFGEGSDPPPSIPVLPLRSGGGAWMLLSDFSGVTCRVWREAEEAPPWSGRVWGPVAYPASGRGCPIVRDAAEGGLRMEGLMTGGSLRKRKW